MSTFNRFDVFVSIWISFVINVALSIVLPVVAIGFVSFPIFVKGFAIAFTVSTLFVFAVPVVKWGQKFADRFKAPPDSVPGHLLATVVLALIVGTLMSLLMTAVNAGFGPHYVQAWLSCYGWALLSVYLSALAGAATGVPLAKKLFGVPSVRKE
jgi:hypothetical protein